MLAKFQYTVPMHAHIVHNADIAISSLVAGETGSNHSILETNIVWL